MHWNWLTNDYLARPPFPLPSQMSGGMVPPSPPSSVVSVEDGGYSSVSQPRGVLHHGYRWDDQGVSATQSTGYTR